MRGHRPRLQLHDSRISTVSRQKLINCKKAVIEVPGIPTDLSHKWGVSRKWDTLQTTLPPQLIDKSQNPIPLERTKPCPILGHETEDETPNQRGQLDLIDDYFQLVDAHRCLRDGHHRGGDG
jgi:hypothetical protein